MIVTLATLACTAGPLQAQTTASQQSNPAAVAIDGDDIGGVDLGTRFAKIAVPDERGLYVVPDLPKAKYRVWVRGYGLVDSAKVDAEPGQHLDLKAEVAPNLAAAAQYYPAAYWYSMAKIPDQSRFPGTGDKGNGIPPNFKTQDQWLKIHDDRHLLRHPSFELRRGCQQHAVAQQKHRQRRRPG